MAYTGQLYQLTHKSQLPSGSYVRINGPWDTYGVVISSAPWHTGDFLHQIRGTRLREGEQPVATL